MLMEDISSYLALRRAAGYQLGPTERLLRNFARFCSTSGETTIQTTVAISWASQAPSTAQRARRLTMVRLLARHLHAENLDHEIPPENVFSKGQPLRREPVLLSPAGLENLLSAAAGLGAPEGHRAQTFYTLFALLATTGLRVSEALGLCLQDLTQDGLLIRETKFHKTRLVPLHLTAQAGLDRYLARRKTWGGLDDHLFVSRKGAALPYQTVVATFLRLARGIGLRGGPGQGGPRIHDLRHGFAVRSLEQCPLNALGVTRHMVALSTYLGHGHVAATHWYLHATPRLLEAIATVTEEFMKGGGL